MGEVFGVDVPSIKDVSHLYSDKVVGGFYNSEGTLTDEERTSRVTEEFRKAKPGDVIQIYWDTGAGYPVSQHTAIISTTYETENKVQFLHSHWEGSNIRNTTHTYARCAECIRDAGASGGFTIYRFVGEAPEPPVPETQAVALDSATILDDHFRRYLKNLVSGRSMMTAEEVAAIKTINLGNDVYRWGNITSLKGVEYFTALTSLGCNNNKITELDLSKNTALTFVNCSSNPLAYLNVDTCSELVSLYCTSTKLKELYVDGCPKLEKLYTDDSTKIVHTPVAPNPKTAKPSITTTDLTAAVLNQPYSFQLYASGIGEITYTAEKPSALPKGLTLSSSGLLSGTLEKSGSFSFKVKASSLYGYSSKSVKLKVLVPTAIATASLKDGEKNKSYSFTLKAAKGVTSPTWTAFALPSGLSVNSKSGKISGKPTVTGTFSVTVTASTEAGSSSKTLPLKINGQPPKLSGSLAKPSFMEWYSSSLTLKQGDNVTWSISECPPGLAFRTETGVLLGTPLLAWSKKITITASNEWGKASKTVSFTVKVDPPKFVTKSLPVATVGQDYSATIEVSGSREITLKAENLPSGLRLEGNTLKGQLSDAGKVKVKLSATNSAKTVSKTYTLKIKSVQSSSTWPEYTASPSLPVQEIPANNEGFIAVVAVLPEVSVDESGMYDFSVTLSPDVEAGAQLVWLAGSSEPSEDDEIAEFADETGKETDTVPESREVTVSAWLNKGIIYRLAIAVRR